MKPCIRSPEFRCCDFKTIFSTETKTTHVAKTPIINWVYNTPKWYKQLINVNYIILPKILTILGMWFIFPQNRKGVANQALTPRGVFRTQRYWTNLAWANLQPSSSSFEAPKQRGYGSKANNSCYRHCRMNTKSSTSTITILGGITYFTPN